MKRSTLPGRIEMVGTGLYGEAYRRRLAQGLGISRGTLWAVLSGRKRTARDVDLALLDLIDRERDATAERGMALTKLKKSLLSAIKVDRDAAA
ncbi:hypothetical protein SAMN05216338_1001873 [Bradyrhizobium sp. Rc2d]|uniref:hypothetical protein n=1 Tax=Bradyrhizobium sp. Rc2d TaxID=1855321 RepID=UPI00087E952B|nr:hypothetical protein [Bradyrhizobium sp. Rc2d]SDG60256.1 hypothetical protein SAMN05216338_1001873 [Bradyrhizobium sp. Rc2d]